MNGRRTRLLWLALIVIAFQSSAFKLEPLTADSDSEKLANRFRAGMQALESGLVAAYIDHFSTPVHEDLTHRAYGCTGGRAACDAQLTTGTGAPKTVIEGVQWNDNPPFALGPTARGVPESCKGVTIQLPNLHPDCWAIIFGRASSTASRANGSAFGSGDTMLQRSHFGDLQFLHAMAPDGETATATRDKIMAWAEFTYRVSIGDITPDTVVSDAKASPVAAYFTGKGWDVSTLFTLGTTPHTAERVQDMAFGSLLHVIQDCFSASHVERDDIRIGDSETLPGRIVEFHSYAHQDHSKHSGSDALEALEQNTSVSSFPTIYGRRLKGLRERRAPWDEVKKRLDDVFELSDPSREAGPGKDFQIEQRSS